MTIDEKTFEAFRNIYIKINDDHIPVEEVITNELKSTSYIYIFIQKIKEFINSFWSKKIMIATFIFIFILYNFYSIYLSFKLDAQTMDYNFEKVVNETLNDKLEHKRNQIQKERTKLFNILTEYEIGTYDKNMHEFYNKVYDVHNELMELEHETL